MAKVDPLVSVIVTTYNRKKLLRETILSVLNQTYSNFELIIVDNYSNYDFLFFMKEFNDNRIIPFQNNNNGIIAINRNYGLEIAKGDYIAFCDDDDIWSTNKIETQLQYFSEHDIIAVGSNLKIFGQVHYFRKNREIKGGKEIRLFEDIFLGKNVPLSTLIVKKNDIKFSENKDLLFVEDFDYQMKLTLDGGKIIYIPDTLCSYRIPKITEEYPERAKNNINIINKYQNFFSPILVKKRTLQHYSHMGLRFLRAGDKKKSKSYFLLASNYGNSSFLYFAYLIKIVPLFITRIMLTIYYYKK